MLCFSNLPELVVDREYDLNIDVPGLIARNRDLYGNCNNFCEPRVTGYIPHEVPVYIKFNGLLCPRYFTVVNNCESTVKKREAIMSFLKSM